MAGLIAILILVVLMGIGVPIAWSFAGTLAYLTFVYDANLDTLMLQGFRSLNSVVLVALPLFVLTGYLMQSGGIARRLIDFIEMLVRGRKGGLGASMVLASAVFGAIAGTATAAVTSIVACSVVIGANSTPVALILYLACRIGRVSVHKAMKPAFLVMGLMALPVMLITTFVPELSLFLPRVPGFH